MSTLLGAPGDRWPLAQAVDGLIASARAAAKPGVVWFAGIFYPSLILNLGTIQAILGMVERATGRSLPAPLHAPDDSLLLPLAPTPSFTVETGSVAELIWLTLVLLIPALIIYRLNVGLACVSAPDAASLASAEGESEGPPLRSLRGVWRAGKGLGLTAFGMWITLMGLLVGAMIFLFGPIVMLVQAFQLQSVTALVVFLVVPVLLMVVGYSVVLQVLNQLALHSLAQNRRGVVSALTHAWRLMRGDPWSAVRATLVDLLLFALIFLAGVAVEIALTLSLNLGFVGEALKWILLGFAGVTRAGFWARAYRGLGGPLRSDGLPGMETPREAVAVAEG